MAESSHLPLNKTDIIFGKQKCLYAASYKVMVDYKQPAKFYKYID